MKIYTIIFILSLLTTSTFAQTPQKIERELVNNLKEVQKYSDYGSNYDEEKLSKANEVFEKSILKYTKIASTLSYKFTKLNELMLNTTSDDGKFRIYSWDTETGGTMHFYSRVYQYLGADGKVYSKTDEPSKEGDAGGFAYAIYTLEAKSGKIYIVCSTFVGSTSDHYDSANLYKINGGKLVDKVKLIKTASGLTDTLNFEYNVFSIKDNKEFPLTLIRFDKNTNTLKIPVVIGDKEFGNGRVTDKFINYKFNGTYFVKQ